MLDFGGAGWLGFAGIVPVSDGGGGDPTPPDGFAFVTSGGEQVVDRAEPVVAPTQG